MGFNPIKAVTRAVGIKDNSVGAKIVGAALSPIVLPTQLAIQGGAKLLGGLNVGQRTQAQPPHDQGYLAGYNPVYRPEPSPTYSLYAGQGEITPYYQGGQQWGSSIPLTTYSQLPSPTYQTYSPVVTSRQDRTWEDLVTVAGLFL